MGFVIRILKCINDEGEKKIINFYFYLLSFTLSPIEVVPKIEYKFQVIARLTKIIKNSKGGLGSKIHWKKSPVSVTFKTSVHNCPEHCISPELYFLLHGNPELSKEYNSIS